VFGQFVKWQQEVRPAMAWTENVPGAEYGGVQGALLNADFTLTADLDVLAHQGRRLRDADVYEVPGFCGQGGLQGGF
jgi:hypothetical protein